MVMFPMVPNVPGVPQLARNASNSVIDAAHSIVGVIDSLTGDFNQLTQDGPGVSSMSDAPRWGLFDSGGGLVITPDSFLGVEAAKDYRDATYPIEEGKFGSYNKVEIPFVGKVTYGKGGSDADRTQFLTDI